MDDHADRQDESFERAKLHQERDLKEKELELNRLLKEKELDQSRVLKEKELKIQQHQLALGRWSAPVAVAVAAGILGIAGSLLASFSNQNLERQKQQGTLILDALHVNATGDARNKLVAANLVFLCDAKLISLSDATIKELREKAGGQLPGFEPVSGPATLGFAGAAARANETWVQIGADTATPVNPVAASCLASQGVTFLARYYSSRSLPKNLTPKEAADLSKNGISIIVVFEDRNNSVDYFSAERGAKDAANALTSAASVGQPGGSGIYFAVDFDPTEAQIRGPVTEYFKAVRDIFARAVVHYDMGVYGSGLTNTVLREAHLIKYTWLAAESGFLGYKTFKPQANLVQISAPEIQSCGVLGDALGARTADLGSFQVKQ
jgi:hypothetical protein